MKTIRHFLGYTWWTWSPDQPDVFSSLYRVFNLLEAFAWALFAALVWARWVTHRKSRLEIFYGLAFAVFSWTDWKESQITCVWLILIKANVVFVLFHLRRNVMRKYPESKMY